MLVHCGSGEERAFKELLAEFSGKGRDAGTSAVEKTLPLCNEVLGAILLDAVGCEVNEREKADQSG